MPVLLLRLNGIMQSWGTDSRFLVRATGREPSKSGVIGLICAAMGRARDEDIGDLAALKMGVREDFPGMLRSDYQTALGERGFIRRSDGGKRDQAVVSQRYYLNGADFLVGLEGERDLLEAADRSLTEPKWHLSLGRKSYVPLVPIAIPDALSDGRLKDILETYPWPGILVKSYGERPEHLRFVIEDESGPESRRDQPVSFDSRACDIRRIETYWAPLGERVPLREGE